MDGVSVDELLADGEEVSEGAATIRGVDHERDEVAGRAQAGDGLLVGLDVGIEGVGIAGPAINAGLVGDVDDEALGKREQFAPCWRSTRARVWS